MSKKSIAVIAFILLTSMFSSAQVVELSVQDSAGNIAYGATVSLNKQPICIVESPIISIRAKQNDIITISGTFYKTKTLQLTPEDFNSDTLRLQLTVERDEQQIEEVLVSSKKIKSFFDIENNFIVDYYPTNDFCYFLLKKGKQYSISMYLDTKEITSNDLSFKAESLYLDGFGNFHILSADSSYQLWINEQGINFLQPHSREFFEENIRPLVAKTDTRVYRKTRTLINKQYQLEEVNKDTVFVKYNSMDKIGYRSALQQKSKIIGLYYLFAPEGENIIENGTWGGALIELAIHWQIIQEIGWYNAAFDNDIPCYSFGKEDHLVIIDFFKDSVTLINYSTGNYIKQYPIKHNGNPDIYYDYFNDQLYFIDQSKRNSYYYQFDSSSGELKHLDNIEGISFAQNIRFCGDWIYFLIQESTGFNKVIRQKIR